MMPSDLSDRAATTTGMRKIFLLLSIIAIISAPAFGQAGAPDLISFQGTFVDSLGNAAADGLYSMTFKLYANSVGGSPIWTEVRTSGDAVQVTDGIFEVNLGDVTSLSGIVFDQQLYLGLAVDPDPELNPRTPLVSAPYALGMRNIYSSTTGVTIAKSVGIGTTPTIRELTVNDTDTDGDAVLNLTATGRELFVGVNQSTGGLLRMITNNNLTLGTNGTTRMTVRSDGDIHVANDLLIGTTARRAMLTIRGPDNVENGPVIYFFGDASDQVQSGRIRFVEGTSSANWRGAFMHYDGSANRLNIGTHNTSDKNSASDLNAITINRSSRDVSIVKDLKVSGDVRKDYGGGSFSSAIPVAMGVVDASADAITASTANVLGLGYSVPPFPGTPFWNIFLDVSCSGSGVLDRYTALVTMRELGVDDVRAAASCITTASCSPLTSCVRIVVRTHNAFGAVKKDFQFVVHDADVRSDHLGPSSFPLGVLVSSFGG